MDAELFELSAVTSGVTDIKKVIESAKKAKVLLNRSSILFIDELHRFNKASRMCFFIALKTGHFSYWRNH